MRLLSFELRNAIFYRPNKKIRTENTAHTNESHMRCECSQVCHQEQKPGALDESLDQPNKKSFRFFRSTTTHKPRQPVSEGWEEVNYSLSLETRKEVFSQPQTEKKSVRK
jgi:hypothetical protein